MKTTTASRPNPPVQQRRPSTSPAIATAAERQHTLADTARLLLCVLLSALGFYVIALLCQNFYHPDIQPLIEESKTLLPEYLINDVRPEPLESLLYNIGLLYFPLSLLGLYALFSLKGPERLFSRPNTATAIIYMTCLGLLVLGFFTLRAPNPFLGAKFSVTDFHPTNFKVFFAPLLAARKPLQYLVFIPAILGLFYGLSRLKPQAYKRTDLVLGLAVNLIALWLLSVIYRMNHYAFPDTWQGQYDLNAVYYSMTQTLAGSPVLIDGVTNTYGGYPLFLAPLFKLIGLDIAHFTLVMSLLLVGCIVCWAYFLNRFSRSRLIAAMGLVALLFFVYLTPYLHDALMDRHTFDSYFANAPIRWLSPALTLLMAALYCSQRKTLSRTAYYAAALLLPLGIVWSPDFGLIGCVAWLLFLLFHDFWARDARSAERPRPSFAWQTELRHIAVWAIGIIVTLGLFALGLRLAYGAWPDYRLLFRTATIFGKIGFFTLPMQACHPWIPVVLTFCIGLAYSLAYFYRRQTTRRTAVVFLLSILGCGLFVYFKSRSYHSNLFQPALYAVMLGILFTDSLWHQVREKRIGQLWLPCAIGLSLIGAAVPESLAAAPAMSQLTRPYHGNTPPQDKQRIIENKAFIQQYRHKTDKAWVLTSNKFQSFYFDKPLLKSAFNPGFLDLNTLADYERAKHTLRDSNFTVFLDGHAFYYAQWGDLRSLLAARYAVDTQHIQPDKRAFSALNPRTPRIPETAVLTRTDEPPLLHRKYADNPQGYDLRIQDAKGVPFSLNRQEFSVEIIFLAMQQHYPRNTLFSQYTDSTGFGLFSVNEDGHTNLYGFACGPTQRLFQIPVPAWNYIVCNFMPGAVDLYVNTNYYGRIPLDKPYRPGSNRLYIGTHEGQSHYIGGISEFAIHSGLQTGDGMREAFDRFRRSVMEGK